MMSWQRHRMKEILQMQLPQLASLWKNVNPQRPSAMIQDIDTCLSALKDRLTLSPVLLSAGPQGHTRSLAL